MLHRHSALLSITWPVAPNTCRAQHTAYKHLLAGSTTSRHPAFSCLSAAKCQRLPSGAVTATLDSCIHAAALLLLMLPFPMRCVLPLLLLALLRRPCTLIPTVTAASSPNGESATVKWWAVLLQNQQCSVR